MIEKASKQKPVMADKSVSTTGLSEEGHSSSEDRSSSTGDSSVDLSNWKAFLTVGDPLALEEVASIRSSYFEEWKKFVGVELH